MNEIEKAEVGKAMNKMKRTIVFCLIVVSGALVSVLGDPLTYKVEGDTVAIVDCKETASGELVIPPNYDGKPVTSIGSSAFYDCDSLTSITIPDSVTSIGGDTFSGCSSLESVKIPNKIRIINSGTFSYCLKLKSITIPNKVFIINDYAFQYCSSLTSVTIPDSVTSIRGSAFQNCSSLTVSYTHLTLPTILLV